MMSYHDKYYDGIKACACDRRYKPMIVKTQISHMFYVKCRSCHTGTDDYPTKEQAIAAWNERH